MSIKKPAAVESPYVTTDTTPTRLASSPVAGGGVSTVASTVSATAGVTANADANTTASSTGSNVSYYTSGVEGIAGLASYGRVFDGANVYVTLEQPQYNTYNQTFEIGNSISVTGNITTGDGYFIGNGSQLTGIVATSTYGNANVVANLAALGTNPVSTTGNVTANYFIGLSGNITNLDSLNFTVENISALVGNNGVNIGAGGYNNLVVLPTEVLIQNVPLTVAGNILSTVANGLNITANTVANGTAQIWNFGTDGRLTFPGTPRIATDSDNFEVQAAESINFEANAVVSIYTDTSGNAYQWIFGTDGSLTAPGNILTGGLISATGNITGGNVSTGVITLTNGAVIKDTSGDSVVFGQNAGLTSQAQHAVAIGINAGRLYQGEDSVAIGYNAGYYDQGRGVAIGWNAGQGGVLFRSVSDAQGGSGPVRNYVSGNGNPTLTLDSVVNVTVNDLVFGNNIPAGTYVVSINAPNINISAPPTAALTAGDDITFVGLTLGINDASNIVLYMRVIGTNIPANTFVQSTGCSFVTLNQYPTAPLVNGASITFNVGQGFGATAIGYRAGESFQDDSAVAVGSQAGYANQGAQAVAVGYQAGYQNQGNAAVAMGRGAGQTTQGQASIAMGFNAGQTTQGNSSVALGEESGYTGQGQNSIAIGRSTGQSSQGNAAIAMGWAAAQTTQGTAAVAMGQDAGRYYQGEYSVAIGYRAGIENQGNNSIVLNATAANLNQTTANTFTVKPVRGNSTANLVGAGFKAVYYNSSTGEFSYSTD